MDTHDKPDEKVLPGEEDIEARWKAQGGIDPATNKLWLTPRMKRLAAWLADEWAEG